jgi:hypothetical protein
MSQLGQFQKSAGANAMSGLPPIATKLRASLEVRLVPHADMLETQVGNYSGNPATSNAT